VCLVICGLKCVFIFNTDKTCGSCEKKGDAHAMRVHLNKTHTQNKFALIKISDLASSALFFLFLHEQLLIFCWFSAISFSFWSSLTRLYLENGTSDIAFILLCGLILYISMVIVYGTVSNQQLLCQKLRNIAEKIFVFVCRLQFFYFLFLLTSLKTN
jgi:hypothetical protein